MNRRDRALLEEVQNHLNLVEDVFETEWLPRHGAAVAFNLVEQVVDADQISQLIRTLHRAVTGFPLQWDALAVNRREQLLARYNQVLHHIHAQLRPACRICIDRLRNCPGCRNTLRRSVTELWELAHAYEMLIDDGFGGFAGGPGHLGRGFDDFGWGVPDRGPHWRRRGALFDPPDVGDLLDPFARRREWRWLGNFFDQPNLLPDQIDRGGFQMAVHRPEPIVRRQPRLIEEDFETTLERHVRDARVAADGENWRAAIEAYQQAMDLIDNKQRRTGDVARRLQLFPRLIEYRSGQLAAMAKDPDYDAIRITNAVQHQMNDIDTFVRNELHLSPERLKKIVTSLAGALISRHFEDLAANRLRQLAGMAHIHNGLVRSEIAYQLGKIYIGQNNAEGLAKLRESVDHARGNPEQLLKCSLAWAEEAEQRGTNIADITDALQGAWDNRAGLPQNEALWSCGHLLGKKYYEQGRMDSAETILRETHTNVPANNKLRVAVARYLVLATDTRAHTPELESLCREVIAGSANDGAQRARFQFILGRAMDSKTNNAEKLTLLRQAHNTMERTTGFTPSELQECAIRLGRALLRARQEQEVAATLLGGAWARNVQLSRRVYVLAAVLWARHLAARGDRAGRGLAGAVYEEMWRAHGSRDLPDDRQPGGDGFWATLLTALGYYANFLSSTRGDSGLLRQVVERGRHIQQQLGLPANAKIEALHQRLNGRAAMRGIPRRRAIAIW